MREWKEEEEERFHQVDIVILN